MTLKHFISANSARHMRAASTRPNTLLLLLLLTPLISCKEETARQQLQLNQNKPQPLERITTAAIPEAEFIYLTSHFTPAQPATVTDWRKQAAFPPISIEPELHAPLGRAPFPDLISWRELIELLSPRWQVYDQGFFDESPEFELTETINNAGRFTDALQSYSWDEAQAILQTPPANNHPAAEEIHWQMNLIWSISKLSHLNRLWNQMSSRLDIDQTLSKGKEALTASSRSYVDDPAILFSKILFLRYASEHKKTEARSILLSGEFIKTALAVENDEQMPAHHTLWQQSMFIDNSVLSFCRELILDEFEINGFQITEGSPSDLRINIALFLIEDIVISNQSWQPFQEMISEINTALDEHEALYDTPELSEENITQLPLYFFPRLISIWLEAPSNLDDDYNIKAEIRDSLRSRMLTHSANSIETLIAKAQIAQSDIYEFQTSARQLYQLVLYREVDNLQATIELTRHWLNMRSPVKANDQINRYPSPTESRTLQLLQAQSMIQSGNVADAVQTITDIKSNTWRYGELLDKAHLAAMTGQWFEAAQLLKYCLLRRPNSPGLIQRMTRLYASVNQTGLAINTLDALEEITTERAALAAIDEARKQLNTNATSGIFDTDFLDSTNDPQAVGPAIGYLENLIRAGELDEALALINKRFDLYQDFPDAHLLAAEIYLLKNQPGHAYDEISAAIALKDESPNQNPNLLKTLSLIFPRSGKKEPIESRISILQNHFWQTLQHETPSRLSILLLHHLSAIDRNERGINLALNMMIRYLPEVPQTYQYCLKRLSPVFDETDLIAEISSQTASPLSHPLIAALELRRDNTDEAKKIYTEGFRKLLSAKSPLIFSYLSITKTLEPHLSPLNIDIKRLLNRCIQQDVFRYEAEFQLVYDRHFWRTSKRSSAISAQIEFSKKTLPAPDYSESAEQDKYALIRHRILTNLKRAGKWREAEYFCRRWMKSPSPANPIGVVPAYLWQHLASAYLGQQRYDNAINVCLGALGNYPSHPDLIKILFMCHLEKQDYYLADRIIKEHFPKKRRIQPEDDDQSLFKINSDRFYNQLYQTTGLAHKLSTKEMEKILPSPFQSDYVLQKLKSAYLSFLDNEFVDAVKHIQEVTDAPYSRLSIVRVIQGPDWPQAWSPRDNPPFFQVLHRLLLDPARSANPMRIRWLLQGIETHRLFNQWDEISKRLALLTEIKSKNSILQDPEIPEEARISNPTSISTITRTLTLSAGRSIIDPSHPFDPDMENTGQTRELWTDILFNCFRTDDLIQISSKAASIQNDTATPVFSALSQWPTSDLNEAVKLIETMSERAIFREDLKQSISLIDKSGRSREQKKKIYGKWIAAYLSLKCDFPELCESICFKLIKDHGPLPIHYNLMCEALFKQNRSLIDLHDVVMKKAPRSSIASALTAQRQVAMGEHVKATETYLSLLTVEKDNTHLKFALAQQWLELKDKDKAFKIFKKLMAKSSPYRHLATYRYAHDKLQASNPDLIHIGKMTRNALRSFPDDPLLLEIMGRVQLQQQKYENALKTLLKALPNLKNRARIHYYVGKAYWKTLEDHIDKASSAYDKSDYRRWAIMHLEQASRTLVLNPDSAAARDLVAEIQKPQSAQPTIDQEN